jgi:hypothetical protein
MLVVLDTAQCLLVVWSDPETKIADGSFDVHQALDVVGLEYRPAHLIALQ